MSGDARLAYVRWMSDYAKAHTLDNACAEATEAMCEAFRVGGGRARRVTRTIGTFPARRWSMATSNPLADHLRAWIRLATWRYVWLTVQHKVFVFRAGLRTGAPVWRLVIHDWSKFLPSEAPHYGRQFFGAADDPLGFSLAWNHHQKRHPHHWEYWQMVTGHNRGGYPDGSPLPMPWWAVREMVADWMGASRAYTGAWPTSESWPWFEREWPSLRTQLHEQTTRRVMKVLADTDLFGVELIVLDGPLERDIVAVERQQEET